MATTTDIQSYFTCVLILLISTLLIRYFFKKATKSTNLYLNLPPSPPSIPFIGHIHHLSPSLYKGFHNLCSKHGPLLYLRLAYKPLLLVSSASMAAEIFKTHDLNFAYRPRSSLPDTFIFGDSGFAFAPYGDYWRFMKKLCVTELLATRQLERSRSVRCEELVLLLRKIFDKAKRNEVVDVGAEMTTLTNYSICRMVMSTKCSGEDNETDKFRQLVNDALNLLAKASFVELLGPLRKVGFLLICQRQKLDVVRRLDELLERLLREHEAIARGDHSGVTREKDMMDLLLEVYQDTDCEVEISRFNMKAFFLDLFFAATSITDIMQWILALLINHPTVLKKVRNEIDSVAGGNRLVEESDIPNLCHLQAVVKEAQRLYPGATATSRISRRDCKIGGFDIPKDTITYVNIYSIMRDPQVWDNPDEFRPERFLNLSKEEVDQMRQDFSFIPFGGGRRMCPGMNLALCMVHTTIAALVQSFDWKAAGDEDQVNMQTKSGFSMAMATPLLCIPGVRYCPFAT